MKMIKVKTEKNAAMNPEKKTLHHSQRKTEAQKKK